MKHIVLLDAGTLPVPLPRPAFEHTWTEHESTRAEEVVERLAGATIAVSNKVPLRRETLEKLPGLKLVAVAATGVDHIELEACRERGVAVANCRDYGSRAVAEHVFALLFALRRGVIAHDHAVRAGDWSRAPGFFLQVTPIHDLAGSTLGIVGHGAIGRATAEIARALGMRVLVAEQPGRSPREGRLPFEAVLEQADAISLHLPLNESTRHLMNERTLGLLQRHAVLVNTARGGLVDPRALADALREKRIAGAALDVLEREPPPSDDPLLALHREGAANLVVTPHVAWASEGSMRALAGQVTQNMEAFVRGEPLRRVV